MIDDEAIALPAGWRRRRDPPWPWVAVNDESSFFIQWHGHNWGGGPTFLVCHAGNYDVFDRDLCLSDACATALWLTAARQRNSTSDQTTIKKDNPP
jgi:hypothetical protein